MEEHMLRQFLVLLAMALAVPSAMASPSGFVDKVISAESSGNSQARPRDPVTGKLLSSAFGAAQFVEATWLDMVRRHRPDLAAEADSRILELRGDFALSRQMTIHLAEENRAYLLREGLKPTDAALYLAHFAGARGAANLLKAHRDSVVEDILSPQAIEANPFLRGKSVAALYTWATAKMNMEVEPGSSVPVLASRGGVTPDGSILDREQREAATSKAALAPGDSEPQVADLQPQVRFIRGGVVEFVAIN